MVMVQRESEERVRDFLDLAEVHLKETPLLFVNENPSVPRVFIDRVHEWEDIWLAPSRFDSSVRDIHHRQIHLERIHLRVILGCEDDVGARCWTSYLEFAHHLFSDFARDVEALQG